MPFPTHLKNAARNFLSSTSGNFVPIFALAAIAVFSAIGITVDYAVQQKSRSALQNIVDEAVIAGASTDGSEGKKIQAAKDFFAANIAAHGSYLSAATSKFNIDNGDTLTGSAAVDIDPLLTGFFFDGPLQAGVSTAAQYEAQTASASGPCVYVLGNNYQALLVNSGADVQAPDCEMHVHSTMNPAFIMNSGSSLNLKKLCVKGTNYIKNGGYISNLETGCAVEDDPYAGTLTEPPVSWSCSTQGAYNPGTYDLNPGVHCYTTFNGTSTVNFKPGLHIIRGTMIVNSGSTINAPGVTFYFPDTDSQIRANGALTMNASAPTSGTYAGVLMFEKTSDPNNNANKRQYIFNGSISEQLEGLIYLPNRDVTYNSTTNVSANKTTLVVNTMIINSANWDFSGSDGGTSTNTTGNVSVRLLK